LPGVDLLDTLEAVVASADHLVLALPGTDQTRGLISAAVLAKARPTAHLINVGRGSVLDHDALVAALDAGALGFATLDVTEPEPLPAGHALWAHPGVRLTPLVASNHTLVCDVFLGKVSANLDRFARGDSLTISSIGLWDTDRGQGGAPARARVARPTNPDRAGPVQFWAGALAELLAASAPNRRAGRAVRLAEAHARDWTASLMEAAGVAPALSWSATAWAAR
jgi:hypothetical protein